MNDRGMRVMPGLCAGSTATVQLGEQSIIIIVRLTLLRLMEALTMLTTAVCTRRYTRNGMWLDLGWECVCWLLVSSFKVPRSTVAQRNRLEQN